jgi:hypothetical protein
MGSLQQILILSLVVSMAGNLGLWAALRKQASGIMVTRSRFRAIEMGLMHLRARCTEAIEMEEVLETGPAKDFARSVAYAVLPYEKLAKNAADEIPEKPEPTNRLAEMTESA